MAGRYYTELGLRPQKCLCNRNPKILRYPTRLILRFISQQKKRVVVIRYSSIDVVHLTTPVQDGDLGTPGEQCCDVSEWADRSTWVSQACVGTSSSVHVHWTGDPWEGVEGVHQTALCLGTAPYRGTPQAPDFLCFISFPTLLRAQEYIVWAAAALAVAAYLLYRGSDRRPQSPSPLHYHSATASTLGHQSPQCLWPCLPLTKNPNCVFLSDSLLAWLRDCLADCQPLFEVHCRRQ